MRNKETKTTIYFSGDLKETCEPEDLLPDGALVMLSFWKSWSWAQLKYLPSQRLRKLVKASNARTNHNLLKRSRRD